MSNSGEVPGLPDLQQVSTSTSDFWIWFYLVLCELFRAKLLHYGQLCEQQVSCSSFKGCSSAPPSPTGFKANRQRFNPIATEMLQSRPERIGRVQVSITRLQADCVIHLLSGQSNLSTLQNSKVENKNYRQTDLYPSTIHKSTSPSAWNRRIY